MKKFIFFCVIWLCFSVKNTYADSGVVKAKIQYWEKNGGFCDAANSTLDCASARYTASLFNIARPLKDVKVYLRTATGETIGQGSSNSLGDVELSWWVWGAAPQAHIDVELEHKDSRFKLVVDPGPGANGSEQLVETGIWKLHTSNRQLTNGTTAANAQNFGSLTWGSAAIGNRFANAYAVAQAVWSRLSGSAIMVNDFHDLWVRAFRETPEGEDEKPSFATGFCWLGGCRSIIVLQAGDAFIFGTLAHEMGHVVDRTANQYRSACLSYCFPDEQASCPESSDNGHGLITKEWLSASLIEGFANFVAAQTLFLSTAATPSSCPFSAETACSEHPTHQLQSSIETANCDEDNSRHEQQSARYFWDLLDPVGNESSSYTDNVSTGLPNILDAIRSFPSGTANHQASEACAGSSSFDGRSVADFSFVAANKSVTPFNSANVSAQNCGSFFE